MSCECERREGGRVVTCAECLEHQKKVWLHKSLENLKVMEESAKSYGFSGIASKSAKMLVEIQILLNRRK